MIRFEKTSHLQFLQGYFCGSPKVVQLLHECTDEMRCQTWGTVELSVFFSAEGMAKAVSSLMVIFNKLQLDDLGSEERRACGGGNKH